MTSPDAGALRLARAFGFALTAFGLSVGAHLAGGGEPPSVTGSLVLGFATVWVSVFLTWRRLSVGAAVAWLGLLQLLLHEGLDLATSAGGCAATGPAPVSHLGHDAMTMCVSTIPGHTHGSEGLAMVAAHGAAAVCLGVLLARADQAVWFLSSLIRPVIPTMAIVAVPAAPIRGIDDPRLPKSRPVAPTSVSRRGPPGERARATV